MSGHRPIPFPGLRVSLVGGFEVDSRSEVCCIKDLFLFSDRILETSEWPGVVYTVSVV
jgi:hypothetical protein